jgi:chromosomal replication initiator protein
MFRPVGLRMKNTVIKHVWAAGRILIGGVEGGTAKCCARQNEMELNVTEAMQTPQQAGAFTVGKAGDTLKAHWQKIQLRLRAELGEDLFNSWFGRMDVESCANGHLTVSVPTRFLKSWIESHYVAKLQKIAESEMGSLTHVAVKVRQQGIPAATAAQKPQQQRPIPSAEMTKLHASLPSLVMDKASGIDEAQTFESFMVGPSNQLAHAAALRVAMAQPGAVLSFNPLFIHAAAGFGKSHLLNAIAHKIKHSNNPRRVLTLSAERFMYGFIQAIRQRDTLSFKDQFNSIDVLLIDDFQFLQGKAIQQEFGHAFNALVDQRRQVVIAADVPPAQLDAVDQRMRSRMMGGLVVDIEAPDEDLRCKIVRARHQHMLALDPTQTVPTEVLDMIALRTQGGGRELEGALNRVIAYQQFNNTPITLDLASVVLRDASGNGNMDPGRIKIDDILKIVGRHYNVAKADLLSPRRARAVVVPRQIGMYLAKKLTSRSLPEIGRRFGGRDHSTVLHAVRKIDEQVRVDEKLAKDVALLIRLMEQV